MLGEPARFEPVAARGVDTGVLVGNRDALHAPCFLESFETYGWEDVVQNAIGRRQE